MQPRINRSHLFHGPVRAREIGTPYRGSVNQARPVFVLHEHHRPRHHFDLRLEENGVLRSWAVPKGMPTDPDHNRLAIPVDDHELEHARFEDATKQIADTGWWELEDRDERRFVFVLHGRTRARRYALISTGTDALLHLHHRQPPDPEPPPSVG